MHLPFKNTTSDLYSTGSSLGSQYPHHSIPLTVSELDNIVFLLLEYSINRETQKHFNYSNNFRLQDPRAINRFALFGYG